MGTRVAVTQDMTHLGRTLIAALIVVSVTAQASAQARRFDTGVERRARVRPSERVEFSLENGDLMDLIRMMTTITGRRFLVTGTPRTISATIASTEPVSAREAYQAFLAILHLNGMTVVRRGRYHVITETDTPIPPPVVSSGDLPRDERLVTWVHRVRHVPVAEAAQLLDGLKSSEAHLLTYAPTGTLIVIDTGASVRRMRRILREIDVAEGDAHVWVEPVHHAEAAPLAELLSAIFESDTPAPRAPAAARRAGAPARPAAARAPAARARAMRILPEERTNSLILVGAVEDYQRAIALLRTLDREDEQAGSTVEVRRLQHANAEAVAATLTSLLGGSSGSGAASAPAVEGLGGRVRVEAHTDLNALVVTASASDYRRLERLIDELDVAPQQVFLEMVLMELTIDDQDQVGVNVLSGLAGIFGSDLVGFIGGGGALSAADALSGLALGLTGPLVHDARLPGGAAPSFGIALQALATSDQANIISTPYVMALDNREAEINIGQNVPLQGSGVPGINPLLAAAVPGASDAASGAAALSALSNPSSGGRRDTGTIVHVTPHVNEDGEVRLEIQAEDSRAGGSAAGNLGAAILNQSIARTELVARDGQTVVIGGLMRDAMETRRSGIPFLSEIPIIGLLFGSTTTHVVKRNLLFFITPHIIRSPRDMRAIFERRIRERREFLERQMALQDDWEPPVDYSRTRGLVGEILEVLDDAEAEAEAMAVEPAPTRQHVERPPVDAPTAAPGEMDAESAVASATPEAEAGSTTTVEQ